MHKRFLFVFSRPPHASLHVQEMLDMTLTAAAFDQSVSLLLIDDGVYALKSGQAADQIDCKEIVPLFESLGLYGVDAIYVEAESLAERGLAPEDLRLPVRLLGRTQIAQLMAQQDVLVNA
ncbi:MAG: sulfurtransferase complex subunit TusC [Gammaproteobacteria bacterium]